MKPVMRAGSALSLVAVLYACGDDSIPPEPNQQPTLDPVSVTVNEDESATVDVLASATDPDGGTLVIASFDAPAHGTVTETDAVLTYTPYADYHGPDQFGVRVSDGQGATVSGTVNLTVVPVNDPPVAVDDAATVDEDETAALDVLANDTDVDGDALVITDATASRGSAALVADAVRYSPIPDFAGADTVLYSISDGAGGTASAIVAITVAPVADAPVAADDSAAVEEGGSVLVDVLGNDTDADGDALQVASVGPPAHGTAGEEDGQVRYAPEAGFTGDDAFTYVVSDGTGLADTAAVHVTVTRVNHAPVAGDDALTVEEDGSGSVAVLANDSDPDGDSLSIAGFIHPAHGSVSTLGDEVVYSATETHYNGDDSFRYILADAAGAVDTATVSVTITPVDDMPQPMPDSATVQADGTVLIDVLANDIDVDGDSLRAGSTMYYPDGIIPPDHGTAVWEDGQVRYTPDPGYTGTDTFIYWMTDGQSTLGEDVYITVVAAAGDPAGDAPAGEPESGVSPPER